MPSFKCENSLLCVLASNVLRKLLFPCSFSLKIKKTEGKEDV